MASALRYVLLGAVVLAGIITVIPAVITIGLYVLAVIGTLATVRKLFPNWLLPESTLEDSELKRARKPTDSNTPGRPQ
jgi:hypothetical protein